MQAKHRESKQMRSILIHTDDSPLMEARFQTGLDIARHCEGHIMLHINTPLQRFVAMDPFGGAYLAAEAVRDAQAHDAALVDQFAARLAKEDVPWNIETSTDELATSLVSAARLTDLIIITNGTAVGTPPGLGAPVAQIAVGARCPVLAVPATAERVAIEGRAMLCWDGGHESANALRAAVPLLVAASGVDVVTVAEKAEGFPATEALRYLSHYGIHAELHERQIAGGLTIEETLEDAAVEINADWVVLGAFGHSRLRETLFGGVTRYFITSARFPLLLVH